MLRESGIPADPSDLLIEPGPAPADPDLVGATIVHPGAASAARRWPAERFATVARAEAAAGRRVLITGTAPERPLAVRLAEMAGLAPDSVVAGQTSLADLVALIGHASRLICGDTGVAHVASATATPSVVLFGPIPPSEWGPPRSGPHIANWAGRRGDPHGSHTDPGLLEIDPEQVIEALARLPERSVSPRPGAVGPG
jgi:ADP-heptose:LPS heptosyltransferase